MALRMHPREKLINDAEVKLLEAVCRWLESPEANALTEWEGARVLNSVFGLQINSLVKFAIGNERLGDTSKEGGLV